MATAPEDITDPNAPDPNADPNAAHVADGGDGGQEDDTPEPVIELAREMGWTPREEYSGPPENFKDARTFIRDGRDIQRDTARELKALRGTVDTMVKTSGSIVEQQVNERVDKLTAQFNKAVEDDDKPTAFRISREIDAAMASTKPNGQGAPPPEAQDFASRNSAWFNKEGHEVETARAVELSKVYASQGYTDPVVQLRMVEQRMRKESPELFKGSMNGGKPAPGVNAPGSRSAGASNRQKGFSDMPKAAQDIARDMSDRLGIKVEDYARNYFANEAAKG